MTGFFDEIKNSINFKITSNIIFESEILSVFVGDFIEINIKQNCTLNEYSENIDKCGDEISKLYIPMRMFYTEDKYNYVKQKLFIIDIDNLKYFINISDKRLLISQNRILDSNIQETVLNIDLTKKDYKITKYIHDLNYSTKEVKWYPQNKEYFKNFTLEKKDAFELVQDLLINLKEIDNIEGILNIEYLYMMLNIVKDEHYNPVINDDLITLSWPYKENKNINSEMDVLLEIILNETKEIVGEISFNYNLDVFSYRGNVGYFVNEQYQNHHYATKALDLLKQLLKSNEFEGNKDLYISTEAENIKSQKVIQNNGGELVYEGSVPETYSLNYIDGVKDVKVYKIKM